MGLKCFLIIFGVVLILEAKEVHENKARYDNYRMYYVEVKTEDQLQLFKDIEKYSDSYTFYGHATHLDQKLTIMVAAHKVADFSNLLKVFHVKHKILTYNFQEKIDEQMKHVMPNHTPGDEYNWDHYFHLESINSWLEYIAEKYEYVTLIDMGESTEGNLIKGVKLAKKDTNTAVFVESGIHAREWIAPATATFILNELLTSNDTTIQNLANNFNWFIYPVVNPDGYKYSFTHDRMWRKNRQRFGFCRGVDLNRNYPFHWNETGSSPDPCRYDYAGPGPASEIETQRLIEYVKNHVVPDKIQTYLALHSFSQLIMFPYGYTPEKVENYDDLSAIGQAASDAIQEISGRHYRSGSIYETIYASSGGSKDWAHAEAKIPVTFTFELRGPSNSPDLFILPADEIIPTGQETLGAFKAILQVALKRGYYNV